MERKKYIYGELADKLRETILKMEIGQTIDFQFEFGNRLISRFYVLRSKGKIPKEFKIKSRTIQDRIVVQRII